ncbi:hypothetical protein [Bradyrhizobium sp. NAS80.1]|uniref:hypothetical protein n=1 Tax=Bradyrhizobium sp. NAS80.1 TaxID=1680159 RepID=UPI00116105D0|nr:hypothetical protein [Bradyrhizobium sp. NAS80.1]
MKTLKWALEIVQAPDLEALGALVDQRLRAYVAAGVPGDESELSGRQAFEHPVRTFFVRARERGFFSRPHFPDLAKNWVSFVDQNKAAESEFAKCTARRLKSSGPNLSQAAGGADKVGQLQILPTSPVLAPFDFVALAQGLATEMAKHFGSATIGPAEQPHPKPDIKAAELKGAAPASTKKMSDALAEFLKPADRKRQHKMKGRGEAEAVVQFAVDFLGDPHMGELSNEKWTLLDEALPDIPNRDNIPREFSKTLFQRYEYAKTHDWSDLVRVTTTTIKSRYWGGLYKFIDWAIQEKLYLGPRPKFECIDPENLAPLPRDAFDDEELLTLLKQPLFTGCKNRTHVWREGGFRAVAHLVVREEYGSV